MSYASWSKSRGLNPFHPEDWSPEDRRAFEAGKLATFRAHWRWMREKGQIDVYYATGGRRALIDDVRSELREAMRPAPVRNPWKQCPCHPLGGTPRLDELGYPWWGRPSRGEPEEQVTDAELDAWIAEAPFARASLPERTARCLAFVARFAPGQRQVRAYWEAATEEAARRNVRDVRAARYVNA
jgi:hypothetical protein